MTTEGQVTPPVFSKRGVMHRNRVYVPTFRSAAILRRYHEEIRLALNGSEKRLALGFNTINVCGWSARGFQAVFVVRNGSERRSSSAQQHQHTGDEHGNGGKWCSTGGCSRNKRNVLIVYTYTQTGENTRVVHPVEVPCSAKGTEGGLFVLCLCESTRVCPYTCLTLYDPVEYACG